MTDYLVTNTELTSIANAIRTKGGTSSSLEFPDGFITAIGDISGGSTTNKQVKFIDYDGTLLHSYTAAEANNLTELPENPTHTGLTAQGWNWTLAQIKAQLTAVPNGDILVGQMYVTSDGATKIDITLTDHLDPYLVIAINGTVVVDWGDNSQTSTITGTSSTSSTYTQHVYQSAGDYTISITVSSGTLYFYRDSNINNDGILSDTNKKSRNHLYRNSIKAIRLGNNINIDNYTFGHCYSLSSITIPSSVTSIGSYAFQYCYSLSSITIPSNVTSIKSTTFTSCYSLLSIAIPSGITSIGSNALQYCTSLLSITIPSSATSIGSSAFQYCSSLSSITIPSGITSIENYTFSYCTSLSSITIPSTVTSIGSYAFQYCYSLSSITIPSSVTSIGTGAFGSCYSLSSITIPSKVASIGSTVFQYCYSLSSATISSSITSIGVSVFANCSGLLSVTIPSSVTSIGNYAFSYNYSLSSITIPSNVTSIGTGAFQYCYSLSSITIPSNVTSIGTVAFSNCSELSEIHFKSATPPTLTNSNTFTSLPTTCIIYVPTGHLSDYTTASYYPSSSTYTYVEE